MRLISSVSDLAGKKVLVRVDFDVPVNTEGKIEELYRIKSQKENIDYLVERGAHVYMVAHIASTDSFESLITQIQDCLGYPVCFSKDLENFSQQNCTDGICLLENIRLWPGEKNNDSEFAQKLAQGFDMYVNNAFAVSHRNHASVVAIAKLLPSYAGILSEKEVTALNKAVNAPIEGKVMIMGGAKAETKVTVVKNFLDKAEKIVVGGILANDILKAQGSDVDFENVDEDLVSLLSGLDVSDPRLILPEDYKIKENKILDIGPKSVQKFIAAMQDARMIIWNGPLGLYEDKEFEGGTKSIVEFLANHRSFRIIGGGDTIAAIDKYSSCDKFDFVSTGGGAMLYFLAGQKLPGLEVLN